MSLKKGKYKITLYNESVCAGCVELKKLLDDNDIPYIDKCITVDDKLPPNEKLNNTNNRWGFIDFSNEHPKEFRFSPVLVIEDEEFNFEFLSSGYHFDKPEEALATIKEKYQE
jgi:glutaredoxin